MIGINTSYIARIPTPWDAKACNYYYQGSFTAPTSVVVETIEQYLARVTLNLRSVASIVAILLPVEGYTIPESYPINDWSAALINFDYKYYTFVGGLADENFVEINFNGTSSSIQADVFTPDAYLVQVDFATPFSGVPAGDVRCYRYGEPYEGAGYVKRMDVMFRLANADWLTGDGFIITIDPDEVLSGVIVDYVFAQKNQNNTEIITTLPDGNYMTEEDSDNLITEE